MTSDRWKTSVHEAGHAVAAVVMGGRCAGLVLVDDGGLAQNYELLGAREAYAIAAGPAAERLVEQHPAPTTSPAKSKVLTVDEIEALSVFGTAPFLACQLGRAADNRRHFDSDERTLALWAITGREDTPGSWATMLEHANRVAAEIIARNSTAVVRIAAALFVAGSLSEDEILSHFNEELS
ncbi:MAG: M50 family metallopeptidase [Planctomycetaceae bacterium]|nr:M50 family metallopeptidase [Planctomycetaceae bacterium]